MQLTVEDLEPLASHVFDVWLDQPELHWFAQMWAILADAGLTGFETDVEYHLVLLRFLALGGIYRDYCLIACDEHTDLDYADWLTDSLDEDDDLQLNWFVVGQLAAKELADAESPWFQPDEKAPALEQLVDRRRREVVIALVQGLGWELGLFESLYRSSMLPDDELDEEEQESARSLVELAMGAPGQREVEVWSWIQDRCPRRWH